MEQENEKTELETAELLMEEEYSDICADLIISHGHEKFLRQLGTHKSGTLVEAASLAGGSSKYAFRLHMLEEQQDWRLYVMWTEHPEEPENYCVIIFFLSPTLWSYSAIARKSGLHF